MDDSTPTQSTAPAHSAAPDAPASDDHEDADLPVVEVKDFASEHVEEKETRGQSGEPEARLASSPEPDSSVLRTTSSSELPPTSPSQRSNSGVDDPPSVSPSPLPSPSPMEEDSQMGLLSENQSGDDADVDASSGADLEQNSSVSSNQNQVASSSRRRNPRSPRESRVTRNQDPDIPNLSTQDYAYRTPHTDHNMFREYEAGDAQPEAGLTRENMRQLNLQLVGDQVKEREDFERRQRRSQVQLRRNHSRHSKSSDDTLESPEGGDQPGGSSLRKSSTTRRPVPRVPRSRGSLVSYRHGSIGGRAGSLDGRDGNGSILLDSGTGSTTNSGEPIELDYDLEKERDRVRTFFETKGYMPAPKQTPENIRRRLRVIRRLGLENPGGHMPGLQRFTRLAATLLKAQMAMVSIIGKDKNWIIAAHGSDLKVVELESAFCAHTVVATGKQCLTIRDARKDWRFAENPFVNVKKGAEDASAKKEGSDSRDEVKEEEASEDEDAAKDARAKNRNKSPGAGKNDGDLGGIRFYAGSPLIVGKGPRAAVIGSLCLLDTTPRDFKEEEKVVLGELADCVVSELELIYAQRASIESAKLHQISVDFLRRSLKSRPHQVAGKNRYMQTASSTASGSASALSPRTTKRNIQAPQSKAQVDTAGGDHQAIEDAILGEEGETAAGSSNGPAPRHDPVDTGRSDTGPQSSSNKRTSGADGRQSAADIDIYDEACSEIRSALDAYAVAIVDLSQFHLFYPTFAGSSTGGGSTRQSSKTGRRSGPGTSSRGDSRAQSSWSGEGTVMPGMANSSVGYSGIHESDASRQGRAEEGDDEHTHSERRSKRARQTYALKDPTAPSRTPQVLYIPSGRRGQQSADGKQGTNEEEVRPHTMDW